MTSISKITNRIFGLLDKELGTPGSFFIPLNPVPASRPRVGAYGTFYPKTYATWKKAAEALKVAIKKTSRPVLVVVESVVQRPATTKRDFPKGDVDNYAKAPLDVMTKLGFWDDDDQVLGLFTAKRFTVGDEEPGTHVYYWSLE